MLAPDRNIQELAHDTLPAGEGPPPAELEFYESYEWTLNPHLQVRQAVAALAGEIAALANVAPGWQAEEVATNVYLLSCGLINCVDEYLRGPALRLPSRLAGMRIGRAARWTAETVQIHRRPRRRGDVRRWREQWLAALHAFLRAAMVDQPADAGAVAAAAKLAALLKAPLPDDLLRERVGIPSPFRRLDLTHRDVIALGECFAERFPDQSRPILLVGLRTSGSYFAPLLHAFFVARGYQAVAAMTLAPSKGPGPLEQQELARYAAQGYTAVVMDDPPHTGGAIYTALEIVRRAGFEQSRTKVLIPMHPARRHLFKTLPADLVVSLDPDRWHKGALLVPEAAQQRLADYFGARGYRRTTVVDSEHARALNARLQHGISNERGARLKRVFEVRLETPDGRQDVRTVLAKSVGCGWLGYHAFIAGHRLAGFVPPILGQRDGILYMEWIEHAGGAPDDTAEAKARIDTAASYIAARTRQLGLGSAAAGLQPPRQDNAIKLLRNALANAAGPFPINHLAQRQLKRLLRRQDCPFPTFIDGNMQSDDWVAGPNGLLKTDYEHHGLGKEELNIVDPAYDLADIILHWQLSADDELRLVQRYVEESGDAGVEQRLILNKLLAGLWSMKQAHDKLFGKAVVSERQELFHRQFMTAWDFLTVQVARYCGRDCRPAAAPHWRAPLVTTDIDGVLDRRLFGFPTTTQAGVEALSLLHANDIAVAVNTARSVREVKAYCEAYSLEGGVAEHGSYIWDAVNGRGKCLIDAETAAQLEELRAHLRRIPGIFLDERHEYSIRAFTYRDKPRGLKQKLADFIRARGVGDAVVAPLSSLLVQHLMTELRLDRLSFHQTVIDTTITAKDVDKGTGLRALRDWVLDGDAETIAIGDTEQDLTMFAAATRAFAPANIGCAAQARLVGCRIVDRAFQRGLLAVAQEIVALYRAAAPRRAEAAPRGSGDLLLDALCAADRPWHANLRRVLFGR